METQVVTDARAVGQVAATKILAALSQTAGTFLLGCPGGRSAMTTYQALGESAYARGLDLSRVIVVMMDDYVTETPAGVTSRVLASVAHSCERFGREDIIEVLNMRIPEDRQVRPENLWLPDPADPSSYDVRIADAGGIDVFLLACGATDGHVAFNPPGSSATSRTRLVELARTTRLDNLATFPSFGGQVEAVPTHGVTVGIETIRTNTRQAIMLVHGSDKRTAASRLASATSYEPDWPATIIAECEEGTLVVDEDAATQP